MSNPNSTSVSLRQASEVAPKFQGSDLPDPYRIRVGLKTDDELSQLRRRRRTGKRLEKFHRKQNDLIQSLLKPMEEHTQEAREDEANFPFSVRVAVWASLCANFILCVLQLYAAVSFVSLSLIATGIDATFDFGSNIFLYWTHKKALSMDINKWPVGGSRLETIGNVVYGDSFVHSAGNHLIFFQVQCSMASVNLVVIVESVRALMAQEKDNGFRIQAIIAVAAALGIGPFVLFLYCLALRSKSSQVQVLWEDHRNDLFINGFGILMSAGGSRSRWYWRWSHTMYEQFGFLAGKSAPHDFLQLIIHKAMTFSDEIEKIDTVRAYHDYIVEVDIVMDATTPLWKAHDISQQLQDKIEVLPNVERAFVHVDHETTHAPVSNI
ncbi:CDF manganese transporter [Suillus fuscotomentosus]|uniref:CDF manganese transporter n=1 Tax=Suillus fuscotomentosus TaxID=1912939 RepID=A0AAD4E0P4_9AGAM|nr:CDF manganese transporter [Suillus fuscotomentosus]KAG1896103.1 CDF manganese transporter [Suillus fuscotomentosus]